MRIHSQNLKKEDKTNDIIHWRCWIHLKESTVISFCINIPSNFFHININLCENGWGEEAVGFSIAFGLIGLWFGIKNKWLYKKLEVITKRKESNLANGRTVGVSFHSGSVWVSLWEDPMESRSVDPWWWHFSINFRDLIFGKSNCDVEILQEGKTGINMPEGIYESRFKVERRIWKRPRWFFKKVQESIYFEIPKGIPHWGKGENSWDCGMGAVFGIGSDWKGNVIKSAEEVAISCIKTRQKHGSLHDKSYSQWFDGLFKENMK